MPHKWKFWQRARLKMYKYEERRGGFSCASCKWFHEGWCGNMLIGAPVSRDGCCTLWSGLSRFKA